MPLLWGFPGTAVALTSIFVDATTDETRVVDLVRGSTVWSHAGPVANGFRPRTSDFVAALDDPAGDYDLLFVLQVGPAAVIARQVNVSSWCGCIGPHLMFTLLVNQALTANSVLAAPKLLSDVKPPADGGHHHQGGSK
jgi:hypothetical protein